MAKNYFFCVVSGKNSCKKRGHEKERMAFLDLCKTDRAFYLEKGQSMGLFEKVEAGDIVFLTFMQNLVAYGEVKRKGNLTPSREIEGLKFREEGISVKGWDGWLDKDDWIDISDCLEENTTGEVPQNSKVKEIKNPLWAKEQIEKFDKLLNF